jgi:uncharacterized membrane protein
MATATSTERPRILLHPYFICFGSALLMGGLAADAMYYTSSLWQWANFAAWLIAAGLVVALVATIMLVIDFITRRAGPISWIRFIAVAAAALLSLLNIFVHSRDAWTSVVPQGIELSVVVTLLLLVAAFGGWRVTGVRVARLGDGA